MARYLVREEDGTSKFTLEDGSGSILLEGSDTEARLSQLPAEVLVAPSTSALRLSQLPTEVLVQPAADLRLSQLPVEVLVQPTNPALRLSQLPTEVLVQRTTVWAEVLFIHWQPNDPLPPDA